jgi:tRNA-Thr(GGU) m(6)t(6)A37 methyltransferase TsaA
MSEANDGLVIAVILSALSIGVCKYLQGQQDVSKWERAYWGERRGRARVEQEMKRISNIQLNTDEGFFVQPIGEIHSCYRQCIGTPRQGLLVPASRATIKLSSHISPESLVGLEQFSHVWITFKFHLNTNTLKESKNFSSRSTFNAKIRPPMLKKKVGVFATRSPHRPNPVGITLAKIDRIDKGTRTVHLCGCDLVEGTPVLDIKVNFPFML